MNKLLNAGFHRLIKYKPYWLECIAAIAYGLYLMVFNDYGYEVKTDAIMYDAVPFIGIVSGIVISQFIGIFLRYNEKPNCLWSHSQGDISFTNNSESYFNGKCIEHLYYYSSHFRIFQKFQLCFGFITACKNLLLLYFNCSLNGSYYNNNFYQYLI